MCDYSLHAVASRPAKVGDELTVSTFPGTVTKGLASANDPNVAVCLRPGTEVAFAADVRDLYKTYPHRTARFRRINEQAIHAHHDAVELPDGTTILVSHLLADQSVAVLQMPAEAMPADPGKAGAEMAEHVGGPTEVRTAPAPSAVEALVEF